MKVEGLIECVRQKLGRVPSLHSLILFGSLVRGDFIPGTSDVDFFAVLEDGADPESIIEKIKPTLEECSAFLNPVEVDLAWEWLPNLRDPLHLGYPFKFLTVYQQDFRVNHVVIFGEDVVGLLPEYRLDGIMIERLERTLQRLEGLNRKMLHITAGETARLLAFIHGSGLEKDDVLETLRKIGDEWAVRVYEAYLNGRRMNFEEEFLKEFVRSRVELIKKKIEEGSLLLRL
ncbi:nucleotidyltransferase domain-containing protein [Thermococcus sp. LS1]|uniref:nucleotidyltransferase domain-containing protein n=1 Tax=Thermococcus sp. LS1 TaxID=1638259 RepID=UPI00143A7C92|nr:nucleotidyltransferase domain-containing protein [Thermococcus sp. LS1]NJD98354.1 nucleotidyltransferase domain-containing protein [Thermococcus sp. LS1]